MSWTVRLRLVQIAGILLLLECMRLSRSMGREWNGTLTASHWFIIVLGSWAVVSGFTIQRTITKKRPRRTSSTSTPFTRWRAGNIVRLVMAYTVGLYGFCLSVFGGPPLVVRLLFALGILLLLIWTPGPIPEQTKQA